jgi:GxxExxY protein
MIEPAAPNSSDELLTAKIIGLAIEVHRALGPGLLESAYEECLSLEFRQAGLKFERQAALPILYKGHSIGGGYRLDLVVEKRVIVEIKCVEIILPVHKAQLLTYLKLSGIPNGLLLNFYSAVLRDGIRRFTLTREAQF